MADVEDRVFEREFDITPHELYTLLLDPAEHAFMCTATGAYTIGETSCSGLGLEGQSFTHWAGAVAGTYTETQRDTKIAMEWRWAAGGAAWPDALPDGRDAISMTWTFEPVEGSARPSSAEHLIATKALRCTATARMLIVAQCSANP